MQINEIYNRECINAMQELKDKSIDCIIKDPPYGILTGHKIETNIDIDLLMSECFRVLKDNSFLAFFGVMPTISDWYLAAKKAGFVFKEEIIWCKRIMSSPFAKVSRVKENIYIMQKGNTQFYKTDGVYEDIKMPLYLDGLLNIETMKRNIADLKYEIKNKGKRRMKRGGNSKNDDIHNNQIDGEVNLDTCNITTVWSFLPHNKKGFNKDEFNIKHPTVKSIDLFERLIELLSKENDTILDPFIGSGTTAIAAVNTNRNYLGFELDKTYFDIAEERIKIAKSQLKLF